MHQGDRARGVFPFAACLLTVYTILGVVFLILWSLVDWKSFDRPLSFVRALMASAGALTAAVCVVDLSVKRHWSLRVLMVGTIGLAVAVGSLVMISVSVRPY